MTAPDASNAPAAPPLPFSPAWAAALCAEIEGDAAYRAASHGWRWPLALVLDRAPDLGFPDDVAVQLTLERGRCLGVTVRPAAKVDAPFALRAPYATWKRVVRGELDPVIGVMKGEVKLTGSIGTLMMHTRSAKALVECARRVPVRFPDEERASGT